MRIADWLTYAGIEQLKELNRFYGLQADHHSKHDLICSLLQRMNQDNQLRQMVDELTEVENRFLQLIMLGNEASFTMEELLGKGRMAIQQDEHNPRSLVVFAMKRGWIFPGFSPQTRDLFYVPEDIRERMIRLMVAPFRKLALEGSPDVYREEEGLLLQDLRRFCQFLQQEIVHLSQDGAIYRQQQKKLFSTLSIHQQPIDRKGPRFGFGRSYHLYPDRFAFLYDYAYYQGYINEKKDQTLCLTGKGHGKCKHIQVLESHELYRFWIRLYRRPITGLPMIIRWIGLLSQHNWMPIEETFSIVKPWIKPYYYETERSLFSKTIQMMLHLGVIKLGQKENRSVYQLTASGSKWINQISAFDQKVIEEQFLHMAGNK